MAIRLPKKWEKLINVLSNVIIRKCLTWKFTEYMDIIFVILIIYLDHSKTEKKLINDILKFKRYEIKCQIIYSENVLKLYNQIKLWKNDLNSAKYLSFTVKPFCRYRILVVNNHFLHLTDATIQCNFQLKLSIYV